MSVGLQRAFLARAGQRDAKSQRFLLLIAAAGAVRPDTIRKAAAAFRTSAEAAMFDELADPVESDALIRSAVDGNLVTAQAISAGIDMASCLSDVSTVATMPAGYVVISNTTLRHPIWPTSYSPMAPTDDYVRTAVA